MSHDGPPPGEQPGDDLRARLRAADPAASLPPVGSDRVRELLEATMNDDDHTARAPEAARRRRWPVVAAAAAALVLGGLAVGIAATGGEDTGPAVSADDASSEAPADPGASPDTGGDDLTTLALEAAAPPPNLRCRRVTDDALAGMETAFAGTVTDVEGETVTFEVERWYAGGDVDVVEVLNPEGLAAALEGPPDFEPGQRFLITASEGQVTGCGFSAPYSERLERMFARAFA